MGRRYRGQEEGRRIFSVGLYAFPNPNFTKHFVRRCAGPTRDTRFCIRTYYRDGSIPRQLKFFSSRHHHWEVVGNAAQDKTASGVLVVSGSEVGVLASGGLYNSKIRRWFPVQLFLHVFLYHLGDFAFSFAHARSGPVLQFRKSLGRYLMTRSQRRSLSTLEETSFKDQLSNDVRTTTFA